jgi:hypothetical protein
MSTITRTITTVLDRLRAVPATEQVHFHGGAAGPYVCENVRCDSPSLTLGDA